MMIALESNSTPTQARESFHEVSIFTTALIRVFFKVGATDIADIASGCFEGPQNLTFIPRSRIFRDQVVRIIIHHKPSSK